MTTRRRCCHPPLRIITGTAAVVALLASGQGAWALGRIRLPPRLTNEPPAVVTNAVPQPPPSNGTSFAWSHRILWSRGLPWKAMAVLDTPKGILMSTYNRDSRHNAEVHLLDAGATVPRNIYRGSEETIGQVPSPSAVRFRDQVICAAENGGNVLLFDTLTGRMSKGIRIPGDFNFNVCTALLRGRPAIGGGGRGQAGRAMDALTGETLARFGLKGLVAAMAEVVPGDGTSDVVAAIADGEQGLAWAGGRKDRTIKPASVVWAPTFTEGGGRGALVVGSQVDGRLWVIRGDAAPKQIGTMDCSKINRMVFDARRGVVLAAGSRPDTFAAVHPDGRIETIARFEDEARQVSGEQFDADIAVGAGDDVLLARATGSGCVFYRATPGAALPAGRALR